MITSLGRQLRIIRINCDETLKNMSDRIGISSAYLSAIENGNRDMSSEILDKIITEYKIEDELLLRTNYVKSLKKFKINMKNFSGEKKLLTILLTKKIQSLNQDEVEKIKKILDN